MSQAYPHRTHEAKLQYSTGLTCHSQSPREAKSALSATHSSPSQSMRTWCSPVLSAARSSWGIQMGSSSESTELEARTRVSLRWPCMSSWGFQLSPVGIVHRACRDEQGRAISTAWSNDLLTLSHRHRRSLTARMPYGTQDPTAQTMSRSSDQMGMSSVDSLDSLNELTRFTHYALTKTIWGLASLSYKFTSRPRMLESDRPFL
jgi:hypothetical protein